MAITLLIQSGVALSRAGLVEDGKLIDIWFGPGVGEMPLTHDYCVGERRVGRVLKIDTMLKSAFVDMGADKPAIMALKGDAARLEEGRLIEVEVRKVARRHKGAVAGFIRVAKETNGAVGPIKKPSAISYADLVSDILAWCDNRDISSVSVSNSHLQKAFEGEVSCDETCFPISLLTEAVEGVLSPFVALGGGGVITIEETEAITAIDIDSRTASRNSAERMRDRVNREAVVALRTHIGVRRLGGQIVIDFLPVDKKQRSAFEAFVTEQFAHLPGYARAGWTPSGLFSFVLPRTGPSLRELLSTTMETSSVIGHHVDLNPFAVRPAARWYWRFAVSALEEALQRDSKASFRLRWGRALAQEASAFPEWEKTLKERFAGRGESVIDTEFEMTSYVIDEYA